MIDHGFHELRIKAIVQETHDTRTFAFEIPEHLAGLFTYRAGQFCTVRVPIGGDDVMRCYSMSSTPGVDDDLAVTVKRVPGGVLSNWLHDHVSVGDALQLNKPSGVFCTAAIDAPVIGFCGGSGVTPVFSIVKDVLLTTQRSVKLLVANRDETSVIFADELARLQAAHPARFELVHHLDADRGFLQPSAVADFARTPHDAEVFICGPTPFMDLVERGLAGAGVERARIAIERFTAAGVTALPASSMPAASAAEPDDAATQTVTIVLRGKKHVLDYAAGDTVLDTARRGGLKAPFSCELGNCATCMALVTSGGATMRANNALTADEVAEGWVLTCQALPVGADVTIVYENL